MKFIFISIFSFCILTVKCQDFIAKDIKSFGATGDGKTNDQDAFQKASDYFNKRGGNGKLIISKGVYIIGKQIFTAGQKNLPAYRGDDVMRFTNIKNFSVEGDKESLLKYASSLRFGAFNPTSGKTFEHGNTYFKNFAYAATIGICILIQNSSNIKVSGVTMDGNNGDIIVGGVYGDVGRQLPHYGIFITNSKNVKIDNAYIHHFGLDGICVSNKLSDSPDSISITNGTFEYNGRQGFSWIGGNQVYVKNCKFNHTGKAKISSAPGAGVDIEAEVGPISNGFFEDCTFADNTGPGVVALAGKSRNCTFVNCTFIGTTNRSVWIAKPDYTFRECRFYGTFVQTPNTDNLVESTRFSDCDFIDTTYNGKQTYGPYLIQTNAKKIQFTNCHFVSKVKKVASFNLPDSYTEDEKYQITSCTFKIENNNFPANDFVASIKSAALKNCTFDFTDPAAATKKYYIKGLNEKSNTDLGGNRVIFKGH
jgi:Right handed beta helix region